MPEALWAFLHHKGQSGCDLLQSSRLQQSPIFSLEQAYLLVGQRSKMLLYLRIVRRVHYQTNLFDAAFQSLLDDDLNGRLADAIAVHKRQHLFLNGVGGRIHAGAASGGGNDRFLYFAHSIFWGKRVSSDLNQRLVKLSTTLF